MTIDPQKTPLPKLHSLLQGAVVPRPIALASTVDHTGKINLSPFSFFNLFSSNPPVMIFSPSRRGRDNTTKDTYENVLEVPEVVINIVNFDIVQQASLASVEFPRGVDEFVKSGLTPISSEKVSPPRVAESPVSFECIVRQVFPLGDSGGAGNLVICEVVLIHVKDEILDGKGNIDPHKLDAVARMGNDFYCRASGDAIFEVPKPTIKIGIGYDQIPERIRQSKVLTGNDLGHLGNIERLPDDGSILEFEKEANVREAIKNGEEDLHRLAQKYLKENKLEEAWKTLLQARP
jgi:flavin reductase (DIM6/NTAB) family NADH-FMN oxidoreductase RutF